MLILEELKYEKILKSLKPNLINKNIIISTNFLRLGLPKFSLNLFLNLFKEIITPKNIAIQTYSEFSSKNNRVFSKFHTPVTKNLSSLSKFAFKSFPEKRIISPTHSFIFLEDVKSIESHVFESAFGNDSIFSYLLRNNYYWINLGSYLSETCTFMHHVESINSDFIPYRENKNFPVKVFKDPDENEINFINYEYFTQKEEYSHYRYNWKPLERDDELKKNELFIEEIPISIYSLENLYNQGTNYIKNDNFIFIKKSNSI